MENRVIESLPEDPNKIPIDGSTAEEKFEDINKLFVLYDAAHLPQPFQNNNTRDLSHLTKTPKVIGNKDYYNYEEIFADLNQLLPENNTSITLRYLVTKDKKGFLRVTFGPEGIPSSTNTIPAHMQMPIEGTYAYGNVEAYKNPQGEIIIEEIFPKSGDYHFPAHKTKITALVPPPKTSQDPYEFTQTLDDVFEYIKDRLHLGTNKAVITHLKKLFPKKEEKVLFEECQNDFYMLEKAPHLFSNMYAFHLKYQLGPVKKYENEYYENEYYGGYTPTNIIDRTLFDKEVERAFQAQQLSICLFHKMGFKFHPKTTIGNYHYDQDFFTKSGGMHDVQHLVTDQTLKEFAERQLLAYEQLGIKFASSTPVPKPETQPMDVTSNTSSTLEIKQEQSNSSQRMIIDALASTAPKAVQTFSAPPPTPTKPLRPPSSGNKVKLESNDHPEIPSSQKRRLSK